MASFSTDTFSFTSVFRGKWIMQAWTASCLVASAILSAVTPAAAHKVYPVGNDCKPGGTCVALATIVRENPTQVYACRVYGTHDTGAVPKVITCKLINYSNAFTGDSVFGIPQQPVTGNQNTFWQYGMWVIHEIGGHASVSFCFAMIDSTSSVPPCSPSASLW